MSTPWAGKTGIGFAAVASLATVALTPPAPGTGLDFPTPGNTCATITVLPFCDTGDTTGLDCAGNPIADDFVATCPYAGSTSPDVFYSITVTPELDASDGSTDGFARLDVIGCETAYDNQLYILDGAFNEVACVDDACTNPAGEAFRAQIVDFGLDLNNPAGPEYFIAVDGWMGDAGRYTIRMSPTTGCLGYACENEGEGTITPANGQACVNNASLVGDGIADDPIDSGVNDDCAKTTSVIACNTIIGGTSGTYEGNAACVDDDDCSGIPGGCDLATGTCVGDFVFRDLDFYRLAVPADGAIVTVKMTAEFTLELFLFGPSPDCADLEATQVFFSQNSGGCTGVTETATLDAGDYLVLATSTRASSGRASCGSRYLLSVDCEIPCPTDLDGNGSTGFADLTILLNAFTGFEDLTALLNAWGPCA